MSTNSAALVRSVFSQVLGVPESAITADSTPESLPSWDSLTHVSLMLAIESECGVQFEPTELMELRSFSAIVARVTTANSP